MEKLVYLSWAIDYAKLKTECAGVMIRTGQDNAGEDYQFERHYQGCVDNDGNNRVLKIKKHLLQ